MRKKIAAFLAVVMLLNVIQGFPLMQVQVQAEVPPLRVIIDGENKKSLVQTSLTAMSSSLETKAVGNDQVFLEWVMDPDAIEYVLSYHLTRTVKAEFTITKANMSVGDGSFFHVEYELYMQNPDGTYTAGADLGETAYQNYVVLGGPDDDDFSARTQIGEDLLDGFYRRFAATPAYVRVPGGDADPSDPDDLGHPSNPAFRIVSTVGEKRGFGFNYGPRVPTQDPTRSSYLYGDVLFALEAESVPSGIAPTRAFLFLEHLSRGEIYNFELTAKFPDGEVKIEDRLITGVNADSSENSRFNMIPVANISGAGADKIGYTNGSAISQEQLPGANGADHAYLVNSNNFGIALTTAPLRISLRPDENAMTPEEQAKNQPGTEGTALIFAFDLPETLTRHIDDYEVHTTYTGTRVNVAFEGNLQLQRGTHVDALNVEQSLANISVQFYYRLRSTGGGSYEFVPDTSEGGGDGIEFMNTGAQGQIRDDGIWIERFEINGTRAYIQLSDIPAAAIYRGSALSFQATESGLPTGLGPTISHRRYTSKESRNFMANYAYTFPEFSLVPREGGFDVAVLTPYADLNSTYTLRYSDNGRHRPPYRPASDMLETANIVEVKNEIQRGRLRMPTLINASGEPSAWYQIVFSPSADIASAGTAGVRLISQVLYFEPVIEARVFSPTILVSRKEEERLVPQIDFEEGTTLNVADLNMALEWRVAEAEVIHKLMQRQLGDGEDNLTLTYELTRTALGGVASKVFATVEVTVTENADFNSSQVESNRNRRYDASYVVNYEGSDLESTKADAWVHDSGSYRLIVNLEDILAQERVGPTTDPDRLFEYPAIYSLAVALTKANGIVLPGEDRRYSETVSLTLNEGSEPQVPRPENLTIETTTGENEVSATLSVGVLPRRIEEYNDLTFRGNVPPMTKKYNIYISTNQEALAGLLEDTRGIEPRNPANARKEHLGDLHVFQAPAEPEDGGTVVPRWYFSDTIEGVDEADILKNAAGDTALDLLRDGEMVVVEAQGDPSRSLPESYIMDGLDKNQIYYVYVDLELSYSKAGWVNSIGRSSATHPLRAFTTRSDVVEAGPADKDPAAPRLRLPLETDLSSAKVVWDRVSASALQDAQEMLDYEVVRVLSSDSLNRMLNYTGTIDGFLAELPANVAREAFRTEEETGTVLRYEDATGWVPATADEGELIMSTLADERRFGVDDKGLAPNQVYYYYVRTVRKVVTAGGEEIERYSVWSNTTATTSPVRSPINLEVDRSDRTKYDPLSEVILAFDAPIQRADIGEQFELEYSIKEDNGDWSEPIRMVAANVNQAVSPVSGYVRYNYKIDGLTQGTNYYFMVRIYDKKNDDYSIYSNIAETRTDTDQSEYDKERENAEWQQYLKDKLGELLKQNYWHTKDTNSNLSVIYRPTMFNAVIQETANSQIPLVASTKQATSLNYFLTNRSIAAANAANKGFVVTDGDMQILIPPNSFIPEPSDEEYFVRLSVNFTSPPTVSGQAAASRQATISFESIKARSDTVKWDQALYTLLLNTVNDNVVTTATSDEVKKMITEGKTSLEIIHYMDQHIATVRDNLMAITETEFTKISGEKKLFSALQQQMMILLRSAETTASIQGYKFLGNIWTAQTTTEAAGGRAMYSNEAGSYIFGKTEITIAGLDQIPNATALRGLIAKYSLQDFLGQNVNLDAQATGTMVAGIVARITGAQKGADSFAYLQSKGVNLSNRSQHTALSNQEAINLMMYIYENKTNTKVDTVAVRNFAASARVTMLDDRYKKSVQIALQEGFSVNAAMNANARMSVREVLEFLGRLNAKVKL